ncbi:hypothetical protein B296_00034482 [Ensete ventricosum]|uniref:Uncharacterized protein n=1 Tax=Ensete ventricosum TaxID=4639 RepID=A0A426ZS57_ENSVE|nr:hypothetical protein B296_00034482 [Ensete ventricosum]
MLQLASSSSSPSSAFINQANELLLQEGKTEMISLMCQGHDLVGHRLGYLQQTSGQGSGSQDSKLLYCQL